MIYLKYFVSPAASFHRDEPGIFTTGIFSRTGKYDIALFYNGTQHADENFEKLLKNRDPNNRFVDVYFGSVLLREVQTWFGLSNGCWEIYFTHRQESLWSVGEALGLMYA